MRLGLAAYALLIALAACDSSSLSAPASATAAATCGPKNARTLATSRGLRVYRSGGGVYACATGHRSYRLGASQRTLREGEVGPVVVAGDEAAYAVIRFGVDTGFAEVIVRNLADGRELRVARASSSAIVESFQSVESLVAKADGAVAWISRSSSVIAHRSAIQVWRAEPRGESLLDAGGSIATGSLRLDGSRLTWRDGSKTRSATLR